MGCEQSVQAVNNIITAPRNLHTYNRLWLTTLSSQVAGTLFSIIDIINSSFVHNAFAHHTDIAISYICSSWKNLRICLRYW